LAVATSENYKATKACMKQTCSVKESKKFWIVTANVKKKVQIAADLSSLEILT
jgi:hypothetical protein